MTYDGAAARRIEYRGATDASISLGYDGRDNLTSLYLSSGADTSTTVFSYDVDDLRTQEGPFTFIRGGALGEVTRITDPALRVDASYNALGQPTLRSVAVAGTTVYTEALTMDASDHVVARTDTFGAVVTQLAYEYDAAGRLISVERNGVASESSAYDVDGNRTSRSRPGVGTEAMSYDAQGRLSQRGAITYEFDEGGMLAARGGDLFEYGALRRLTRATVGGVTIDYAFDGLGRRTARTSGGQTEHYYYGDPEEIWKLTAWRNVASSIAWL